MIDSRIIKRLQAVVGKQYVLNKESDLITFEYDGSVDRSQPTVVVLPKSTNEISELMKIASTAEIAIVARGAGTGLSGGAIAEQGGILLSLTRMNQILEIDPENQIAVVEPGVVNLELTQAVSKFDLYYAPDPSSQQACTIGGNVAENSGGPHCLAYGVTTNHVLGIEVVDADGEISWYGGRTREHPGYDLRGIMIGSEGTLSIVTKAILRLSRRPESVKTLLAIYQDLDQASAAVSAVISSGIVPAAMEMMDDLAIKAAEPAVNAGYPENAGAVLLVEVEGLAELVEEDVADIEKVMSKYNPLEIRTAKTELDRTKLWAGRKGALSALGRLAPNYYLIDGTIPPSKLVEVMSKIKEISAEYNVPIANVLHAGDGNLHPAILFDERNDKETKIAFEIGGIILKLCVDAGGALSGEHGIGIEKRELMPYMFNNDDLDSMSKLKTVFDKKSLLNPGKIFPDKAESATTTFSQSSSVSNTGKGAYI